jgi:hypothetical protein
MGTQTLAARLLSLTNVLHHRLIPHTAAGGMFPAAGLSSSSRISAHTVVRTEFIGIDFCPPITRLSLLLRQPIFLQFALLMFHYRFPVSL